MGILNATPDSFSDAGADRDLEAQVGARAAAARARARTCSTSAASPASRIARPSTRAEEIERVAPLVARLAAEGAVLSVDTYKPAVARAAIEAGAAIVNDPSGLIDPEVAEVCAVVRARRWS